MRITGSDERGIPGVLLDSFRDDMTAVIRDGRRDCRRFNILNT